MRYQKLQKRALVRSLARTSCRFRRSSWPLLASMSMDASCVFGQRARIGPLAPKTGAWTYREALSIAAKGWRTLVRGITLTQALCRGLSGL